MADPNDDTGNLEDSGVMELTGKIMVAAVTILFFVLVFAFALHVYAKRVWYRRGEASTTTRRRRRLDFPTDHLEIRVFPASSPGLDPSILRTIPVIVFNPKEFKEELECAVCLCVVSEGEKARLLPKCNHGFHLECIDMWFQSHSTCPLCRNPVADQNQLKSIAESTTVESGSIVQAPSMGENAGVNSSGSPSFPTNVLIWGNETEVSTFGHCAEENHQGNATTEPACSSSSASSLSVVRPDGLVVIDIPRRMMMNEEEEQKSPVPTRLRSLKRLLSGNRRVNPLSPRNLNLEQGARE